MVTYKSQASLILCFLTLSQRYLRAIICHILFLIRLCPFDSWYVIVKNEKWKKLEIRNEMVDLKQNKCTQNGKKKKKIETFFPPHAQAVYLHLEQGGKIMVKQWMQMSRLLTSFSLAAFIKAYI